MARADIDRWKDLKKARRYLVSAHNFLRGALAELKPEMAHYDDLDDVFEMVICETGKLANTTRTSTRQIPYRNGRP